jgi:MFS family permease
MMKSKILPNIPANVWVLGFVSLLTDISTEMIHSVLPLFLVSSLGANLLMVGSIEGIAESTASVLKVFSGALSDYLGKRKFLAIAGYGLSTLVKPLFALAVNPTWVLIARFGDRLGKGIRVAPRDALVADATDAANRGAAYGFRQSLDTVGAFLGPLAAFGLLSVFEHNFRLVFAIAVLPGILAVALLAKGIREPKATVVHKRNNPLNWTSLLSLGKSYWLMVTVALLFNLGNSSEAFLLLRAEQIGITANLIPLTLVVMNIAYSLSAYPLGLLSDRIGRIGLLSNGLLIYALTYFGFAFVNNTWQVWVLFGLYGLYQGMSQGLLLAFVADQVPANLRGTAFGGMNLATGIVLLPANLIAGILWESISPQATFICGGIFALSAIVLLLITVRSN